MTAFESEAVMARQSEDDRVMDGQAPTPDTSFEAMKWKDELALRTRELDIRETEVKAVAASGIKSRWSSPLVIAVLAAAVAAAGNAAVGWINGEKQMQVEGVKSEAAIILEAVKGVDPDRASQNLRFMVDMGLVKDPEKSKLVRNYVTTRQGGSGVSVQFPTTPVTASGNGQDPTSVPSTPAQPTTADNGQTSVPASTSGNPEIVSFETGWLGGGHSQASSCDLGRLQIQPKYPGKTLTLINSSETSKKDLLGRVEYRYFCTFSAS